MPQIHELIKYMRIHASKLLSDDLMKLIKNPFTSSVLYLYLEGIVFPCVFENQCISCNMGKLVTITQLGSETKIACKLPHLHVFE